KSADELDVALQKEIDVLLQHARDLRDVAGRDLLVARGEAGEVEKYQEPTRSEPDILEAMAKKGDVDTKLAPEVVVKLRAAIASGTPLSLCVQFGAMTRELDSALRKIPTNKHTDPHKEALDDKSREMSALTDKLEGVEVPEKDRLD